MPANPPRRVLAVGDIHGCSRALDAVLEVARPGPDDLLITLGDMVDRGPDPRGVVERLVTRFDAGMLVPLRGNHELMILRARASWPDEHGWRACGGQTTLASYAPAGRLGRLGDIPDRHWRFLANDCLDWFQLEQHIFVHAGVDPNRPVDAQTEYDLFWGAAADRGPHRSGKLVLCGHTEQRSGLPLDFGHTVCIDTAAYSGGWLTCLDVHSGEYWQANEAGATRIGCLARH